MGYIVVLILGTVVVVGLLALFVGGRKRPVGQTNPRGDDVTPKRPAADEPTPGASSTANQAQVRAAQKHTPPA